MPEKRIEEELLENGSYATAAVGDSMRPLFASRRDIVIISPLAAPPKKYDVILYHDGEGKYVLHRIIGFKDGFYVTRGDNTYRRERIDRASAVGVLSAFNRKGKRYETDCFSYKLYSRVWCFIYPVRRLFFLFRSWLSFLKRKIFRRGRK